MGYVFLKNKGSNFQFWERGFGVLSVQGCRGKGLDSNLVCVFLSESCTCIRNLRAKSYLVWENRNFEAEEGLNLRQLKRINFERSFLINGEEFAAQILRFDLSQG